MTPLRVEFALAGPMERPADPIHLDALIANRLVARDLPADASVATVRERILDLPLERREVGGDWVWAASSIAFDWISPPLQAMATLAMRAPEIAGFTSSGLISNFRPTSKIETAKGIWKAGVWYRERQWASRAVAYCVGDELRIRELLSDLDRIGPRRRLGVGVVTQVRIIPDDAALDLWSRRLLPAHDGPGYLAEGAYRLPAFDPANRTIVRARPLEFRDAA